jgi:hypothetical protein
VFHVVVLLLLFIQPLLDPARHASHRGGNATTTTTTNRTGSCFRRRCSSCTAIATAMIFKHLGKVHALIIAAAIHRGSIKIQVVTTTTTTSIVFEIVTILEKIGKGMVATSRGSGSGGGIFKIHGRFGKVVELVVVVDKVLQFSENDYEREKKNTHTKKKTMRIFIKCTKSVIFLSFAELKSSAHFLAHPW